MKLILTILLTATLAWISSSHAAERAPNIVFFLVDDLGWKDLGCYGSSFYETPHVDQLAQQGVRFTNAYAACHVCSPTRASIMTGKYPARLKLTDWLSGRREFPFQQLQNAEIVQQLPLSEVTIAEALKQHGYQTMHIGKWHLGEDPYGPLQQGFNKRVPQWNKGWPKAGYHAPFKFADMVDQPGEYLTDRLTDSAEAFIQANQDRPFFLYLSHFAVHDPIQGREDLVDQYHKKLRLTAKPTGPDFILEGNPDDPQPASRQQLDELAKQASHQGYKVLPQRTVKIKQHQDNPQFAAMVSAMDESLGRIVKTLESVGVSENTIIVFFSDNGGMSAANFGNPKRVVRPTQLDAAFSTSNLPLRGAKGWLYEGGIRVPLIVKWPGTNGTRHGKAGEVCDEPVISTDFFPTLLEMAGLPAMPQQAVDGVSFAAALEGKTFERGPLFWHFPHYSNHGMQSPGGAIRSGHYKLLESFENGTLQLYNLQDDLGEQHDLVSKQPAIAKQLHGQLQAWRERVHANMMPPNPNYNAPSN